MRYTKQKRDATLRIDVLTIFPGIFTGFLKESIIKRGQEKRLVEIKIHNLRRWTYDRHRSVDDRPFGGGPGMVMRPEPIFEAVKDIKSLPCRQAGKIPNPKSKIILLTPQGKKLDQKLAKTLSRRRHLVLICGHYEGVDERVRQRLADLEISIGDYVTTGGEVPAMVFIDVLVRLIPGVLGDKASLETESFTEGLLEYPHYTRPRNFRGMKVPEVLLSGNHEAIANWREKMSLRRTHERRPELIKNRIKN